LIFKRKNNTLKKHETLLERLSRWYNTNV